MRATSPRSVASRRRRFAGFEHIQATSAERTARVDLALLVDLIASGWRGVERRLDRLERILDRMERSLVIVLWRLCIASRTARPAPS